MPFDNLRDFKLSGPALPEPFVRLQLEAVLKKNKLLPAAKDVKTGWDIYRRHLRRLGEVGGSRRVKNHVLDPLVELLGYATIEQAQEVETREGPEDGGFVMKTTDGSGVLRCWTAGVNTDLDAPTRRGRAFRFSLQNIALRVLWKQGERAGLITDGDELRLIIVNPSGRESFITFDLTRSGWRGAYTPPDSFRLFLALARPEGIRFIPDLTEQARLAQAEVTKTLRDQARNAITDFLQGVLQHHENRDVVSSFPIRYTKKHRRDGGVDDAGITDPAALANELWREGLVIVYRLLFILKLESSPDPARAFSFASTSLWRNTYSPNTALSSWVKVVLDERKDTGSLMEDGLRALFRLFVRGLKSSELHVSPLGGQLFGPDTTPLLDQLTWGEQSVALLLQHLLWTPATKKSPRMRVHYGYLDVEDLGRVYEALLEREPGIATERMCRLKRDKLEVVVPHAQGEPYRAAAEEKGKKKSKVEWVEEIPAGRFYLRVGLGRKSSGSYYTPDAFVKFLVQETLGPLSTERSPLDDPQPAALLTIKVLDPAMGSGHFLVEACRFLGERLYEACRRCDELALALQAAADAKEEGKRIDDRAVLKELDNKLLDLSPDELRARADELYRRVEILPDPNDELLQYLPSRSIEGGETSGVSVWKARALCRRLVAVHCLYGVDKNPLAVELAKLVLWLESYSEGYPLTFLDHRLIQGDSLTGPFFKHLGTHPIGGDNLLSANLEEALGHTIQDALAEVRDLEASVGKDVADLEQKQHAEQRLRARLAPLNALAAAWSGGVMLGKDYDGDIDAAYDEAAQAVAGRQSIGTPMDPLKSLREMNPVLDEMLATGREGVAYDLRFPEVFWRGGKLGNRTGFDVVLGNPPWEGVRKKEDEFFTFLQVDFLDLGTKKEKQEAIDRLLQDGTVGDSFSAYVGGFLNQDKINDALFKSHQARVNDNLAGRGSYDQFMLFAELAANIASVDNGFTAMVLPSSFHSNEGATGIRRIYLHDLNLLTCYSFENRAKLFEIDSRYKFALIVARRSSLPTVEVRCQFYLQDVVWLNNREGELRYSLQVIEKAGGDYLSFPEFRGQDDVAVAETLLQDAQPFGEVCQSSQIKISQEANLTYEKERFVDSEKLTEGEDPRNGKVLKSLLERGHLLLHEGKTFHQYDDTWGERPRYLVPIENIAEKDAWRFCCRFFRLSFRAVASATNERTAIFMLLPPGTLASNSSPIEKKPSRRCNAAVSSLMAVANSHAFDWYLRQKASTNINLFILNSCAVPARSEARNVRTFLAHSALRLSCNHEGYEPLWREQLCYTPELEGTWREERPPFTWPLLEGDDARWKVRSAIDAVVAQAYGLTREQYEHILNSFSHKSYPPAKTMCLAAWDELHALGLDAFTKKHDPYHDIPLNEALPKPVITLPGLADLDSAEEEQDAELTEMMDDDSPDSDGEEEEITRPAAKKPKKTPAKVVEVEWTLDWRVLAAKDLGIGAFGATADFLHIQMVTTPKAIRLTSDGQVMIGKPTAVGITSLKKGGLLDAAERGRLSSLAGGLLKARAGKLSDVADVDPEAGIHVITVTQGSQRKEWYCLEGEWPDSSQAREVARILEAIAEREAEVK